MINIGNLNRRVELQRFTPLSNGTGGFVDNYETFAIVWASFRGITGKEHRKAEQKIADVTHEITIRYRKDVDRTQFISYAGRRFEIQYIINNGERNRFLNLFCIERL